MLIAEHWQDVPISDWQWENFSPKELACRHCGALHLDPKLMNGLQNVRSLINSPVLLNSGYRCLTHDKAVGGRGAHTTGCAADIHCFGEKALLLLMHLPHFFTGIGIKQHGPHKSRFIHVDCLPTNDLLIPRPALWSYKDR